MRWRGDLGSRSGMPDQRPGIELAMIGCMLEVPVGSQKGPFVGDAKLRDQCIYMPI